MVYLLETSDLTIQRLAGGEWNTSGKWVKGTTTDIPIKCSIQPFRLGEESLILPEGLSAKNAYSIYTKTPIRTIDQFSKEEADLATIDGHPYVAFYVNHWSRFGLLADHYQVIFVREEMPGGNP